MELLMLLLLLLLWILSRAAVILLSPHTTMHLQGFIYLNCYENTSFTFSMFAVNITSLLEILAAHW